MRPSSRPQDFFLGRHYVRVVPQVPDVSRHVVQRRPGCDLAYHSRTNAGVADARFQLANNLLRHVLYATLRHIARMPGHLVVPAPSDDIHARRFRYPLQSQRVPAEALAGDLDDCAPTSLLEQFHLPGRQACVTVATVIRDQMPACAATCPQVPHLHLCVIVLRCFGVHRTTRT